MNAEKKSLSAGGLVLVNQAGSPAWREAARLVLPFLDHLGVPYLLVDLITTPLPAGVDRFALVIAAHDRLDPGGARLDGPAFTRLRDAIRAGTGFASFDPAFCSRIIEGSSTDQPACQGQALTVASPGRASSDMHFITARHASQQTIAFCAPLEFHEAPGEPLARLGNSTFLGAGRLEKGRWVCWSSALWMDPQFLGPLSGLDDLLWRGLVWAARKPFCLRGLPPIVTMRVDDVAGRGGLWGEPPFYWVEDAIREGFKPWLGLFIYNLTGTATNQLRGMLQAGRATAFPHAFGRPPRTPESNFPYYENAFELRATTYDEFIYFDHQRRQPWSDSEAAHGLAAVDAWYAACAPLPISRVALPHWYELGANTCEHIRQKWGCEFTGKVMDVDLPLEEGGPGGQGASWLELGPFRRHIPGFAFPFGPGYAGHRPVYYADFANFGGQPFFNSLTEIHDDAGYEWAPDNDVPATIARAARQLTRAMDSLALASLFTHETDYIYKIRPENWREIMAGIKKAIALYQPVLVSLEEGMRYLRATKTSRLAGAAFDPSLGSEAQVTVTLEGFSDLPTHFYLFTLSEPEGRLVEIPPFAGRVEVSARLS